MLKKFYWFCAIIGTIIPWFFFARFFVSEGIDIPLFVTNLFENDPAGGFSSDVLISILVFWVWAYLDAKKHRIQRWWIVLPASCTVGLSLALPLYLYIREDVRSGE